MGSNARKTKAKRQAKKNNAGKDRKRKQRLHGTTPAFPLDPEQASKD